MSTRTTETTVTFRRAFTLLALEGVQPAGLAGWSRRRNKSPACPSSPVLRRLPPHGDLAAPASPSRAGWHAPGRERLARRPGRSPGVGHRVSGNPVHGAAGLPSLAEIASLGVKHPSTGRERAKPCSRSRGSSCVRSVSKSPAGACRLDMLSPVLHGGLAGLKKRRGVGLCGTTNADMGRRASDCLLFLRVSGAAESALPPYAGGAG